MFFRKTATLKPRIRLSNNGCPSPVSDIRRRFADNYGLFSESSIWKINRHEPMNDMTHEFYCNMMNS